VNRSPYDDIAPTQRWSTVARDVDAGTLDAQPSVRFVIEPGTTIASAGSCFAGRLAAALRGDGVPYFVAEPAPKWLTPERQLAFGYRPFSARYGLIFSAEQLRQLLERAYGRLVPREVYWERASRFVDPFRPRITPTGYATVEELVADREQHLEAVRRMFEQSGVFLFTLGLTEHWRDRSDGAVFPYCPGVDGGSFDPARHEFHNATVRETVDSLAAFLAALRKVNAAARVILSVSPVPIGATMENVHVAQASTYTKSVLRVAAEEMRRAYDFVDYFAAYELVSQSFFGRDPFTDDRRHLKPEVVDEVVARFRSLYLPHARSSPVHEHESIVVREQIPCDEDILAR
jgi:hypothetical protein